MEYYIVRIYRREPRRTRRGGGRDTRLTGLLENEAGGAEPFHNADELWHLLVRSVSDGVPVEPETGD